MSFSPVTPLPGVAGWRFLERTEATQRELHGRGPELTRDMAYFRDNLWRADTAEKLVADRRLLKVALGAFGLEGDLNKQAFIRKVLEEGTETEGAFATRLVDPAYRELAAAFGYGDLIGPQTLYPDFAEKTAAAYQVRAFEVAVGERDNALRLALNFRREIAGYAAAADPAGTAWFSLMGDTPVRTVMEKALNLPSDIGAMDVDRQRDIFRDAARKRFGDDSLAAFADPARVDEAITRFLLRETIDAGPSASTPGYAALSLLQGAAGGGFAGLVLSGA